jgi:hypothetical protein
MPPALTADSPTIDNFAEAAAPATEAAVPAITAWKAAAAPAQEIKGTGRARAQNEVRTDWQQETSEADEGMADLNPDLGPAGKPDAKTKEPGGMKCTFGA